MMKRIFLTALVATLTTSLAFANQQDTDLDCMIQPHEIVMVGSPAPGVIDRILADRGDIVEAGSPIVELSSVVERAAVAVARERAAQVSDTTIARSAKKLAQRELQRASKLHEQSFVSQPYLERRQAEAQAAVGQSAKAEERRRLAVRELELAIAQLEQRTIRAPISGAVIERFLSPGEYVDQKAILRIAAIHPLRVNVLVPAMYFGQIRPGMVGVVLPELFGQEHYEATVTKVDKVIDAASNTFRARLELPNANGELPAGLRCKVRLSIVAPERPAKLVKRTN